MHIKILIFVGLLCAGFAFALWDYVRPPAGMKPNIVQTETTNKIVPNPSFTSLSGKTYQLHDFKGKVIVLNFWATWCPPCVVEFPELLELAAMRPDNLVFIALSVDKDVEKINRFIKGFEPEIRKKAELPNVIIAHDLNRKIALDMFQTVIFPETYIIAPDLRIKKKIAGVTDWTGDEVLSLIDGTISPLQ